MYRRAVPHPNGQTAAEELFHSGVIPSDTDFRIFRDFGHVPGMDFAHVMNGYRYHTKYDHIDYLPPSVLQRTGDNILALVKLMANSDQLANTKARVHLQASERCEIIIHSAYFQAYETGRMVFFDYLGFVFVAYSETTGQVLSIVISLISIFVSFYSLRARGINQRTIRKEILTGCFVTALCTALSIIASHLIATELDWSGKSMSWYQYTFFAILLYCCPAMAIHALFYSKLTRNRESALSLGLKVQARINGVNLLWSLITIGVTLIGYRSAYVFLLPVTVHLITTAVIALLKAQNSSKLQWFCSNFQFIYLFKFLNSHQLFNCVLMHGFVSFQARNGCTFI